MSTHCDIQTYERDVNDEETPIWDIRETCIVSLNRQHGKIWEKLRIGCLQASLMSEICERTIHNELYPKRPPEELANIVCGLSKSSFTYTQELAMADGTIGEPYVRDWFSKEILHRPINEVGVAIWNKDQYFRNSLDGETTNDEGEPAAVEIKVPKRIHPKYVHIVQSWGKKLNNPHPESYIFHNHYDQMTTGNIITNKHGCYYVVSCLNDGTAFYQYIDTDYELWEKILYPRAKAFHTKYVIPLIIKNKVHVMFPPSMDKD
jgi:hypothetical protein